MALGLHELPCAATFPTAAAAAGTLGRKDPTAGCTNPSTRLSHSLGSRSLRTAPVHRQAVSQTQTPTEVSVCEPKRCLQQSPLTPNEGLVTSSGSRQRLPPLVLHDITVVVVVMVGVG